MMLHRFSGSVDRIKYAFGCTVAAAAILGVYAIWTTVSATKQSLISEHALAARKAELVRLTSEAKSLQGSHSQRLTQSSTGVAPFAVQMATWARAHNVGIESLAPEGEPMTETVDFQNSTLGQWSVSRVNVRGQGQLEQVAQVLKELCEHGSPSRLESFSLQSLNNGSTGRIEFQIIVTVYQKKGREA